MPRGIHPKLIAIARRLYVDQGKLNVLITGPCGVGKVSIARALAHAACRADYSVRSYRLLRFIEDLALHHVKAIAPRS